jgi:hypothetical protein
MPLVRFGRDLRVDVCRGLALWWIFTDHVPGDVLGTLSIRNFALCDATEVFVLLAGYAGGIAYGRTMDRHGWLYAGADVVRRAWTLYIAHIFLFVVFAAQVAYSAAALDRSQYLDEIHLDALGDEPYRALLEALTLHFQPAYLNILPMYVCLLLMFAVALPLLRWPRLLGVLSVGLYAAARLIPLQFSSWTGGSWYFNPLTWQLLFMLGAILSYAPGELPVRRWVADAMAGVVIVFGLFMQWVVWGRPDFAAHLPPRLSDVLMSVDKEGLHPFRLISILALAWVTARLVAPDAAWLRSRWVSPFVLMGQHSLPVFCSGIFLAFLGRLAMEEDDGWLTQAAVNAAGLCAMASVGAVAAWYREKGLQQSRETKRVATALPVVRGADTA